MIKPSPSFVEQPLDEFSQCHGGILERLDALDRLPALLEPAAQARRIARESLDFFSGVVYEHHAEEEKDLFPAVLASASSEELPSVRAMVERLTREHRDVEAQWKQLEPLIKKLAKGQPADVNPQAVSSLVAQYQAHAQFEEQEFLPLSEKILSRNGDHMAALGLSLHMRHQPVFLSHV